MKLIVTILFFFFCNSFKAATNDTLKIKSVEIFDKQISGNTAINSSAINVSGLFKTQSSIFVKDYGPGMLSTITQRGLGANHTNILWEGINIQNPMLGLNDLSIIPIATFSNITSLSGNSGYLNSNGAFGGSVNMQSAIPQNFKISLGTNYNFYKNLNTFFSIEDSRSRFWYRYNLFNTSAKNHFSYLNSNLNNIEEKQMHADLNLSGQVFEIGTQLNRKWSLSYKNWLQFSKRNIPSPIGINNNTEKQTDYNNRNLLKVMFLNKKFSLINTFALLSDSINYYNPKASGIADTSLSFCRSFKNNLNLYYILNDVFSLKSGSQSEYNKGYNIYYGNNQNVNSINYVYFNPIFQIKKIKLFPLYKIAHYSVSNKIYHIYNLSSEINVLNKLTITANYGENYRFPTLNDLYWIPGGNPNLKPETGKLSDFTFLLQPFKYNNSYLKYTLYNNYISNYIVWLPGNNGYFTPQNLKEIWSRGFELEGSFVFNINKIKLNNKSVYAYSKSTNYKSDLINDESIGKQLLYTPIYNLKNYLNIAYKNVGLLCEYNLVSWRAVSTDNYDYLPWYQAFNVGLNKLIEYKKHSFNLAFFINNVLNENYNVIKNRPMPLRNYNVSLIYLFKK